jgi:predicted nucleic acid-binding protein
LNGLQVPNKSIWFSAFSVWVANDIDFTDAFNVATMHHTGLTEIYAWDRGYDDVPGIKRIEPVGEEKQAA